MIEIIFLIAGFAGLIISAISTFKNKISYVKGICLGTICQLVSFVLSVANSIFAYGENPIDIAINGTFSHIKQLISTMPVEQFASVFGDAKTAEALSIIETLREAYIILFPAMIIISYAFITLSLFIVIRGVLTLLKKDVSFIPKFNQIALTKPVLIGGVFSFAMGYFLSGTVFGNAFSNIELVFVAFLTVCGLSLIDFVLAKKIKYGIIRFIIYFALLIFASGIFGIILYVGAFLALIDAFKNFRKTPKAN